LRYRYDQPCSAFTQFPQNFTQPFCLIKFDKPLRNDALNKTNHLKANSPVLAEHGWRFQLRGVARKSFIARLTHPTQENIHRWQIN